MAQLRPLPARKVIKVLKALGFVQIRQTGSHMVMEHPDGRKTVVPVHAREDIGRGLLRSIIKDAGVEVGDFMNLA